MRNGPLSRLDLLEGPLGPVMPMNMMGGSVTLMCLRSGLMFEDCVIT